MNNLKREYGWTGCVRKNGTMGIRNRVLVVYTVGRASFVAREVVKFAGDPGTKAVGLSGYTDNEYAVRLLIALMHHPNMGAVLTVGLGCEYVQPEWLADIAGKERKEVVWMFIQQESGTRETVEKDLAVVGLMWEQLRDTRKKPTGIQDLIIGAECGGSDYASGLTENAVVGRFFDRLTDLGRMAIFEEIVEAIGPKEMLMGRAANEGARQEVRDIYDKALEYCKSVRQYSVSPDNFAGGLPTIKEKNTGALIKSKSRPIEGVPKVGIKPPHPGLWLLDSTPDPYWTQFRITDPNDSEGLMDLAACHSYVVFLAAGRGDVVGSAVVSCIKITEDSAIYRAMEEDMDFNVGPVLEGRYSQDEVAQRLLKMTAEVASGTKSKSEALGHKEYFIPYRYQDRDATKKCRGA